MTGFVQGSAAQEPDRQSANVTVPLLFRVGRPDRRQARRRASRALDGHVRHARLARQRWRHSPNRRMPFFPPFTNSPLWRSIPPVRLQQAIDRIKSPHGAGEVPSSANGSDGFGRATLGDFRIVRQVGRGGMGIVYEAQRIRSAARSRSRRSRLPGSSILAGCNGSRTRHGRRPASSIRTSSPFTPLASIEACTTTPCGLSTGQTSRRSSTNCVTDGGRLPRQRQIGVDRHAARLGGRRRPTRSVAVTASSRRRPRSTADDPVRRRLFDRLQLWWWPRHLRRQRCDGSPPGPPTG